MSFLDAMFGKIFADGVELEVLGGLNFIGFNVTPDETNGRYNIEIDLLELGYDTDDISNNSSLLGGTGTLTAALDAVVGGLAALTTSISTLTTRQIVAGTNMSGGGDLSADRTLSLAAALTGITTINGARVITPTQGDDLADANETLNISTGANYYMPPGTTTAARDKTIGNTGAAEKAIVTLAIGVQGHNVVIKDNGGTTLHTVTAGQKQVVDLWYDSAASLYKLAGWKPLA